MSWDYPHFTPLTLAAFKNDFDQFKRLVQDGADINEICSYGWAPIHLAMYNSDEKIARLIMAHPHFNANIQRPPPSRETPLMYAILFERQELARMLVAREDTNLSLTDGYGQTYRDYLKIRALTIDWLFDCHVP